MKYLVENGAEVNAVDKVRIDKYNITTGFVLSSYCILFKTVYINDNKTDDSMSILCLCWKFGPFNLMIMLTHFWSSGMCGHNNVIYVTGKL